MENQSKPAAHARLNYAPAPRWHRRRAWRRGSFVFLLLVAALAVWRLGPPAWRTARLHYWQRQALAYTAPPDQIVYEEDPESAKSLLAGSGGYTAYAPGHMTTPAALLVPECRTKLNELISGAPDPAACATLFLHELMTPDGRSFLIAVQYNPAAHRFLERFIDGYNCEIEIIRPAMFRQPAARIDTAIAYSSSIHDGRRPHRGHPHARIYAGQRDPADSTHFTIRYEMWGQSDTLDGRLDNTPRVILTPRNPPKRPAPARSRPDVYQVMQTRRALHG